MKILLAITKANWGGAQEYVYQHATRLASDHDVRVALGRNEFDAERTLTGELEQAGIETYTLESLGREVSVGQDLRTVAELVRTLRDVRPDVLHLNSSKMCVIGGVAGTIARTPRVVFTAHGFPFFEDRSRPATTALEAMTRLGVALADDLITLSERERDHALGWRESKGKVHLIPNGVAEIDAVPRDEARRIVAGLTEGNTEFDPQEVVIGSVAELHDNKNVATTLRALAELIRSRPDIPVRYVHFGTGERDAELISLCGELGLHDRCHFLGFHPDARSLLGALDVFVLPSKKEGLPYAILEAGLAGLPVVATEVGGIPSVLEPDAGRLLADPTDAAAYAAALLELADDAETRRLLGTNLQARIRERFTIDHMIESTEAVYRGRPVPRR